MSTVLLVDDEPGVLYTLKEVLEDRGHAVITAASAEAALPHVEDVAAVVTDLQLGGMSGLELIAAISARAPTLPVILLTAHGSERIAVAAVKAGAYDYLTKPFDIDEVAIVIERALEAYHLRAAQRRLAIEHSVGRRIVGDSKVMRRLVAATERLAARDVTVLVRGETGTGKEFVTHLLHALSPRAAGPLVRFNCAAIPRELAEAELFGHVKGAFTGATDARRGFFAEADRGTLVLDEVGELPLAVQAKLLRALQDGEIQPVGSGRIDKVDVRVVAATHRDLVAQTRTGGFREDLYYRLAVVELVVPPLRDRREDIPALAAEFTRHYRDKFGIDVLTLDPPLIDALTHAPWPGNVRELENTIARLAALTGGGVLTVEDWREHAAPPPPTSSTESGLHAMRPAGEFGPTLKEQVEVFERSVIARTLAECGGNQSEAARRLATGRVTLIDKMKKYGIPSKTSR